MMYVESGCGWTRRESRRAGRPRLSTLGLSSMRSQGRHECLGPSKIRSEVQSVKYQASVRLLLLRSSKLAARRSTLSADDVAVGLASRRKTPHSRFAGSFLGGHPMSVRWSMLAESSLGLGSETSCACPCGRDSRFENIYNFELAKARGGGRADQSEVNA